MQEIWASTRTMAKAGSGILKLTLASIGAIIYTKRSAMKARAAFRRALAQQGFAR